MSEVEELVNLIKQCWPKLVLTKENLLRPTAEVVLRFYNNFIDDYNDKVDFSAANYEPEEQLFLQLSKFFEKIAGLKFMLADIYEPSPIRTKNFFKICTHFVIFIEELQNEADVLGNSVFKAKEDSMRLSLELQELKDTINENAKTKAELCENKKILEQEDKSTKNDYKRINALIISKEKLYAEKRNQIENLKHELHNAEYQLKRLEVLEKDLSGQRITEREHQSILNTIQTLKCEWETLVSDDIGIGDGLVHENKILQYTSDCIRILDKRYFSLENIKKLIQKEDELKVVSDVVDKLTNAKLNPLRQQKLECEQKLITLKAQLLNLQGEYKMVRDSYDTDFIQFSQEINKLKDHIQDKCQNNYKVISDYKEDIKKLEQDLDKLKKAFTTQYIKVSKIEKVVVDTFKETLMKFKESG